ncbi:hypothetical protein FQN57_001389 [Myotisia sp. PD_48]|nr:hypothetical protein FQN57_001389 [Myotisia sp. PD_48]
MPESLISEAAFAYHEPPILIILNLTGLLLVLNIISSCLDKLLYCGLIGQIFIGILWGTPGARWLGRDTETFVQQIGYLGLIMMVYEGYKLLSHTGLGGLSTSTASLKANLPLSLSVAITGIVMPIALSFILKELVAASFLQAFAAGAALSATSLGTTFAILSTTELIPTRLGIVITSAAMMDDIIGLVMVQIISNLGGKSTSFNPVTVIRPVFVSIGGGVGVFLLCRFLLKPLLDKLFSTKKIFPGFSSTPQFAFLAHTCVLIALVTGATYAGTSSLFAAYLAGVVISWFDSLYNTPRKTVIAPTPRASQSPPEGVLRNDYAQQNENTCHDGCKEDDGSRKLSTTLDASIGFAIPIREMFQGNIVWRGLIYALLMTFAKMITGLWLVRIQPSPLSAVKPTIKSAISYTIQLCAISKSRARMNEKDISSETCPKTSKPNVDTDGSTANITSPTEPQAAAQTISCGSSSTNSPPPKPISLYPASILGLAMIARGEIGYLIASIAESQGVFSDKSSQHSSEIYLVTIWAISICTLIGPISVGTLVKRVRRLQRATKDSDGPDPLGIWGV